VRGSMEALRFEDGLSALVRDNTLDIFGQLAVAEVAGVSPRIHDCLREQVAREPNNRVRVCWFGEMSYGEIASVWEALRRARPLEILNSVASAVRDDDQDHTQLSLALASIIEPLILLQRGSVLRGLHAELSEHPDAGFAARAATALGACGEWDEALGILEQAHSEAASLGITEWNECTLWKHAYLQGEVDTILPKLAAIPFHRHQPDAAEGRAWRLVAYQLRAGRTGIHVPAIAKPDQSFGYIEAAAMAIAALEGIGSAEQAVAELRHLLVPSTTMDPADRKFAGKLTTARIRVAARRRDYAKLSTLAQTRFGAPWSGTVIDALLEEGDWRGAAEFAVQYDPRDHPVDDSLMNVYCMLQLCLAVAAAGGGDDASARAHLDEHLDMGGLNGDANQARNQFETFQPPGTHLAGLNLRTATLLAGAAEGVIPRRVLPMLLPVLLNGYLSTGLVV
jgi:hypothetical protein